MHTIKKLTPQAHPNTSVSIIVGLTIAQLVWILGLFGVAVPEGIAAGWTTLAISLALFLGGRKPLS